MNHSVQSSDYRAYKLFYGCRHLSSLKAQYGQQLLINLLGCKEGENLLSVAFQVQNVYLISITSAVLIDKVVVFLNSGCLEDSTLKLATVACYFVEVNIIKKQSVWRCKSARIAQ